MVEFSVDDKKKGTLKMKLITSSGEKVFTGITREQYELMKDDLDKLYDDETILEMVSRNFKQPVYKERPTKMILESKYRYRRGDINVNVILKDIQTLAEQKGIDITKILRVLNDVDLFLTDDKQTVLKDGKTNLSLEDKKRMYTLFKKCFVNIFNDFHFESLMKMDSTDVVSKYFNQYRDPNFDDDTYNDNNYKSEIDLVEKGDGDFYSFNPVLQQSFILCTFQILFMFGLVDDRKGSDKLFQFKNLTDEEDTLKTSFFFKPDLTIVREHPELFHFSLYVKNNKELICFKRKDLPEDDDLFNNDDIITPIEYFIKLLYKIDKFVNMLYEDTINIILTSLFKIKGHTNFYSLIPIRFSEEEKTLVYTKNLISYERLNFEKVETILDPIVLIRNNFTILGLSSRKTVGEINNEFDKLDVIINLLKKISGENISESIKPVQEEYSQPIPVNVLNDEIQTVYKNLRPTEVIKRLKDPYENAPLKKEIETFDMKKLKHVNIAGLDITVDENDDLYNGKIEDPINFLTRNINPLFTMFRITKLINDKVNDKYKIQDNDQILSGLSEFNPEPENIKVGFVQAIVPIIRGAMAVAPVVLPLLKKGFGWVKEKIKQRQQGSFDEYFSQGCKIWDHDELEEKVFKKNVDINKIIKDFEVISRNIPINHSVSDLTFDNIHEVKKVPKQKYEYSEKDGDKQISLDMGRLKLGIIDGEDIEQGLIPKPVDFIMRNLNPLYKTFKMVELMKDKNIIPNYIHKTILSGLEKIGVEEYEPQVGFVQALIPIAKTAVQLAPIVYPILKNVVKKGIEWIKNKMNKQSGFDYSSDSENECGTLDVANIKPESRNDDIKDFSKFVDLK